MMKRNKEDEIWKTNNRQLLYFKDVNIVDGLCRIDGITFVFTTVTIEERPKMED